MRSLFSMTMCLVVLIIFGANICQNVCRHLLTPAGTCADIFWAVWCVHMRILLHGMHVGHLWSTCYHGGHVSVLQRGTAGTTGTQQDHILLCFT